MSSPSKKVETEADITHAVAVDDNFQIVEKVGRPTSLWGDAWKDLRTNPLFVISAIIMVFIILMAIFPGFFAMINNSTNCPTPSLNTGEYCWRDPGFADLSQSAQPPSADHWMGTDLQGRDLMTRIFYGASKSLTIAIVTTIGTLIIALTVGSIAGYFGGVFDAIIARIADVFFAIPGTLAGIAFLSLLPERGVKEIALVFTIFGWPGMMRIVRSSVLSEKEKEYVQSARALGASPFRIIVRHILPNAVAPVLVIATLVVGGLVGAEATLSFLGVGLQLPTISWGLMVSEAQKRLIQAPHLLYFPGFFISCTVFSFILMGDALRDALDPRLR